MNRLLKLCLVVALAGGVPFASAQVPPLQKGISVELPATHNAAPMPDADQEDSFIVSITADGSLYVGIDPVHRADLAERIKKEVANRTGKNFYIKADARTAYANVVNVLLGMRAAGVAAPIFLTAQKDPSDFGAIVPPKGLEVRTVPSLPDSPVVRLIDSGPPSHPLTLNGERVSWDALLSALDPPFHEQPGSEVLAKADATLPFADVVRLIDLCHSAGAKVVLVTPML